MVKPFRGNKVKEKGWFNVERFMTEFTKNSVLKEFKVTILYKEKKFWIYRWLDILYQKFCVKGKENLNIPVTWQNLQEVLYEKNLKRLFKLFPWISCIKSLVVIWYLSIKIASDFRYDSFV